MRAQQHRSLAEFLCVRDREQLFWRMDAPVLVIAGLGLGVTAIIIALLNLPFAIPGVIAVVLRAAGEDASNVDRSLAVIDSFRLTATVIEQSNNRAVVRFVAWNDMTLGSAIGPTDGLRSVLNSVAGESGPLSRVSTVFSWTEPLTW